MKLNVVNFKSTNSQNKVETHEKLSFCLSLEKLRCTLGVIFSHSFHTVALIVTSISHGI
jgi:hypothetical protein